MITIQTINDLPQAAQQFIAEVGQLYPEHADNIIGTGISIAFFGEMGAGKTTFIKELCAQLGVVDNVSSPTFAIVNEYHTAADDIIYHFDFYRVKNEIEVYDLGYEYYFFGHRFCLIEWPEKVEALLPGNTLNVNIEVQSDGTRQITLTHNNQADNQQDD